MKAIWLMLVGAAAATAYGYLRAAQKRDEHRALKSDIVQWEGEGGNVPQVPTPSPVVTPETSVPRDR